MARNELFIFSLAIHIFLLISPAGAQIEGLYCGKENCYDSMLLLILNC